MEIDIFNVEDIVFSDKKLRKLLYRHNNFFNQWDLCQRNGFMNGLAKKIAINFLNLINDEDVKIISSFFKENVDIKKTDNKKIKTYSFDIECQEVDLDFGGVPAVYREKNRVYVLVWR